MSNFPVAISDEFAQLEGQWYQYDVVPLDQRSDFHKQKHVNIRSFVGDERSASVNMLTMDRLTMYNLDGNNMATFSVDSTPKAKLIVQAGENWTFGKAERQADRNNWYGITVECDTSISNLTTTQSVITRG